MLKLKVINSEPRAGPPTPVTQPFHSHPGESRELLGTRAVNIQFASLKSQKGGVLIADDFVVQFVEIRKLNTIGIKFPVIGVSLESYSDAFDILGHHVGTHSDELVNVGYRPLLGIGSTCSGLAQSVFRIIVLKPTCLNAVTIGTVQVKEMVVLSTISTTGSWSLESM